MKAKVKIIFKPNPLELECCGKLAAAETEVEELKNKQEDLEYYLENATSQVEKLDRYLCEAYQKLHTLEEGK